MVITKSFLHEAMIYNNVLTDKETIYFDIIFFRLYLSTFQILSAAMRTESKNKPEYGSTNPKEVISQLHTTRAIGHDLLETPAIWGKNG